MILSTLVTSQLHFEMCAGLYGHPVFFLEKRLSKHKITIFSKIFLGAWPFASPGYAYELCADPYIYLGKGEVPTLAPSSVTSLL